MPAFPVPSLDPAPPDLQGRRLHDLRISVTDRCNFRCVYCMPIEVFGRDAAFVPRDELLTYEEMARLASIFTSLGVGKVRVTGGEPLVRRDLPGFIAMLAAIPGLDDIALTTNGSALARLAQPLADAGLRRVTVSLDSIDQETFSRMNGIDFPVARVLAGIDAARAAGLDPIKVNVVVRRGLNDADIVPLARWARAEGLAIRFIEYMDVGHSNGWKMDDVVSAEEVLATIGREWPLEPLDRTLPGEVAARWRYVDGGGEVGVIASVTQPFCGACTRARISAVGELYTCLFASRGTDLRSLLRDGASDAMIGDVIRGTWARRDDRYSDLRSAETEGLPRVEMFAIGG
jgi:cyclic pyranopterin phosphate synthase